MRVFIPGTALLALALLSGPAMGQDVLGGNSNNQLNTRQAGLSRVVPVDMAFQLDTLVNADGTILLNWRILQNHYLYRKSIAVLDARGNELENLSIPEGEQHTDEYFGDVEIYYDQLQLSFPAQALAETGNELSFTVQYQGCAEELYCYPLQNRDITVPLP